MTGDIKEYQKLMYKVYLFEQLELVTEEFIDYIIPLLPEERVKKTMRFRSITDKKNCVIAFLMLKIALKQNFHISDFILQYGKYGKPYLADHSDVYFNISHCSCGCAVAVADCPVGVDIQDIRSFSWEIAHRVCCKEELEVLVQSTEKDREFTRMWTLKESYVKMLGMGIGCELIKINTLSIKSARMTDWTNSIVSICSYYEM